MVSSVKKKCSWAKKVSLLVGVLFLLVGLFGSCGFVRADTYLMYSIGGFSSNKHLTVVHPSSTSGLSAYAFIVKMDTTGYVRDVQFYLGRTGVSLTGWLFCVISNYTGTLNSSAVPDNSEIIEVSGMRSVLDIPSSGNAWLDFYFSGDTQLTAGTAYAFYVTVGAGFFNDANYVRVNYLNHAGHDANSAQYLLDGWGFDSNQRIGPLQVYGSLEPESTPTATPTATLPASFSPNPSVTATVYPTFSFNPVGGGTDEEFISAVVNVLVPIIFLVFPAFLLGVVLKGGKWGFMIGMMIGASLGFIFFSVYVPLWLVFAVFIGIAAMAWGSR